MHITLVPLNKFILVGRLNDLISRCRLSLIEGDKGSNLRKTNHYFHNTVEQ